MKKLKVFIFTVILGIFMTSCSVGNVNSGNSTALNKTGVKPENQEYFKSKLITNSPDYAKSLTRAALPVAYDLSAYMAPVKNQGGQGSCVGWAVGYYTKTYQERLEEKWDDSVLEHQFSPAWVYNQINGGSDGGSSVSDALNLLVQAGCDTWSNFPYTDTNYTFQPDLESFDRAAHYKSSQWFTLPNDVEMVKNYLYQGNVVIFSCAIYPDFDSLTPDNPVYDVAGGWLRGYHALTIVGYDESKRAFKFINSWGESWGTWKDENDQSKGKGFGWISYDLFTGTPESGSPVGVNCFMLIDGTNTSFNTPTPTATVPVVLPWAVNVAYKLDDLVSYNNKTWKCAYAHTSNAGWYPGCPGLWLWTEVELPTPSATPTPTATVSINVSLIKPLQGQHFVKNQTVEIEAQLTNVTGSVKVEFWEFSKPGMQSVKVGEVNYAPYRVSFTPSDYSIYQGNSYSTSYMLAVVKTKNNDTVISEYLTIYVDPPMEISIVSPAADQRFLKGQQVEIEAQVNKSSGPLKVEFWEFSKPGYQSIKVGEATTAPYKITFTPSFYSQGTAYSSNYMMVSVTNQYGQSAISDYLKIIIDPANSPTPTPTFTATPTSTPTATATVIPTPTTPSVTAWVPNKSYIAGDKVSYSNNIYVCRQPHTSLLGWEPVNVPSLWTLQ